MTIFGGIEQGAAPDPDQAGGDHDGGGGSTGIWNPEEHTCKPGAPGGSLILDLPGAFSTINLTGPSRSHHVRHHERRKVTAVPQRYVRGVQVPANLANIGGLVRGGVP
jgi:hypothetical protein